MIQGNKTTTDDVYNWAKENMRLDSLASCYIGVCTAIGFMQASNGESAVLESKLTNKFYFCEDSGQDKMLIACDDLVEDKIPGLMEVRGSLSEVIKMLLDHDA